MNGWRRESRHLADGTRGDEPELIAERVRRSDRGGRIYLRYRHLFPNEVRAAAGRLDQLRAPDATR